MDTPRDPRLQEQLDKFRVECAADAAFFQHAVNLLAARRLVADLASPKITRPQRLQQPSKPRGIRWLRERFLRKRRPQQERSKPHIIEGVVISCEAASPTGDAATSPSIVIVTIPADEPAEHDVSVRKEYLNG